MEFGFKETKTGYAKAEVDAVVMNLQHTIEELQLRDMRFEKKRKEVSVKVEEIRKDALESAKKIVERKSTVYSGLDRDVFTAFKELLSVRRQINKIVQSKVQKLSDDDITSFEHLFNEAENDLDVDIKFLKSMMN